MAIHSRNKGMGGEREFIREINVRTGIIATRNLEQVRNGGADLIGVPGWAPEVKRCESLLIDKWWEQTLTQAAAVNSKPVLAYRQSRQPWRLVIRLADVSPVFFGSEKTCTVDLDTFCELLAQEQ